MQRITPCLWFDDNAEEAVRFYTMIFKRSRTGRIARYGEGAPMPAGSVLTIQFWLEGQEFVAVNGGPMFHFTEAVSLMVNVKTQKELDAYWDKLSRGGEKSRCGWLKDKFGLSWQVVPVQIGKWMAGRDSKKVNRMMQALLKMKKLDIKALEKAYAGE